MFSLRVWQKPNSDDLRIYVHGTTRDGVYLCTGSDGTVRWSSRTKDTPYKFQTGNHYKKIDKDSDAAAEVATAYGWVLGETDFETVLAVARDGIQVSGE